MEDDLFVYLAAGLFDFERTHRGYPYPELLRFALNRLAARMLEEGQTYPQTFPATLEMFHQPLAQWWPESSLPEGIDEQFPLLYEGMLDEQVSEFLQDATLPKRGSPRDIQIELDNRRVLELLQVLREMYHQHPERAEKVYTKVRRFLIKNPVTTNQQIVGELGGTRGIDLRTIQALYQSVHGNPQFIQRGRHWVCPHCGGLLRWSNDRPRCVKPSVCNRLYPDYGGRTELTPHQDLLTLRWGVHARTCIPGIRELALFEQLTSEEYRDVLEATLWPGVDRYDLQLRFTDGEVWAVDVKDYKNPLALGKKIAADRLYEAEVALRWQQGFYVVPFYRTDRHAVYRDYLQQVQRRVAEQLPENVKITDEAGLLRQIREKTGRLS